MGTLASNEHDLAYFYTVQHLRVARSHTSSLWGNSKPTFRPNEAPKEAPTFVSRKARAHVSPAPAFILLHHKRLHGVHLVIFDWGKVAEKGRQVKYFSLHVAKSEKSRSKSPKGELSSQFSATFQIPEKRFITCLPF